MRVDMTPMLIGKSDKVVFSFEYEGAEELFPELTFEKPINVFGDVINRSGYMLLTLNAEVCYSAECARCLKELRRSYCYRTEKNVAFKNDVEDGDDDTLIITDSGIELDETVGELLFLEMPSRELCKEDCAGFCPRCGKDLNEGECSCEKKEIDPRLAVLKKFLDKEDN